MESVHSLSFGAAVLKVLKDAKIEDDSQGGGENDETRFCKTVFSASGARCPNNGTAGRYTLSRDRRESEILRTIGQEEANRQEINPIWIWGVGCHLICKIFSVTRPLNTCCLCVFGVQKKS